MASFWDMLGQAASVMQLTGVDGVGIASMLIQAARTVRRNKDLCEQLANRVQVVSDLLGELQIPELRRHPATRRPLDQLRRALFCAYMLVWSCGQQQQKTSQLYQLWRSADMASMLRDAREEIDGYIILIPMVTAVASVKARGSRGVQDSGTNNDPAPAPRPQLSTEEVTESLTHEVEWQPIEHVRDLVSMIAQSAGTARHNRDQCQQLAQQAQIVSDQLQGPLSFDTQRALEQLEDTLFRTYMLICFFSQYNRTQLHLMFTGADVDSVFRLAQDEISSQINLMTYHVSTEEPHDEVTGTYQEQDESCSTQLYLQDEITEPQTAVSDTSSSEEVRVTDVSPSRELPLCIPYDRTSLPLYIPYDRTSLNYKELSQGTQGFSANERLGSGAFYRGSFHCHGARYYVAIKRLDSPYIRSEFVVSDLLRLSYRNLVRFVGCSCKPHELLLVYELMPNGCLDTHLYGSIGGGNVLPWLTRHKIILGVGSALLYLHHESHPPVVHGNIKPSNVMLDMSFNAKLGDFWLPDLMGPLGTTTDGYKDPERESTVTSQAADVYSFGILLLEIACGRRPIFSTEEEAEAPAAAADNNQSSSMVLLARWVLDLYARDALLDAADPRLAGEFEAQQMERVLVVGLWCTHPDHTVRQSSVWEAMRALQRSEVPLPDLPESARPFQKKEKEEKAIASNITRQQALRIAASQLFPAGGERKARERRVRKSRARTPEIVQG